MSGKCNNFISGRKSVTGNKFGFLYDSIATAVFVRSSSNLKCGSHIRQQTVSSIANNAGSSKH